MRKTMLIISNTIAITLLFFAMLFPRKVQKAYGRVGITKPVVDNHPYYINSQWDFFANRSKTIDPLSTQMVFFGDSHTNGLAVENIFDAVNFGISGETVQHASSKISEIKNLQNKTILLAYGVNDIPMPVDSIVNDYSNLISKLPKSAVVNVLKVLPVNEGIYTKKTNSQINKLNSAIEGLGINVIDTGKYFGKKLDSIYQKGDGIHLNKKGNMLWAKAIKEGLTNRK